MSFRHIAVRVAARRYVVGSRSDVLNEVEATFNNMGVYPPSMKEVGPDTYEGEIDTGYLLRVQELDDGLDVSLNDYLAKDLMGAVGKYKEWKKAGGPPTAGTGTGTGTGPFTGTMDGLSSGGLVHFTIDKMEMDRTGLFHTAIRYHWESPKPGGGTSVNEVEAEVQYRLTPGYDSDTLSLTVNGKPATEWYDAEQKGLFDFDYLGPNDRTEVFHEDEWSDHATQLYFEAHDIPINPGEPLEGDDAVRVYEAAPDGAGTFI